VTPLPPLDPLFAPLAVGCLVAIASALGVVLARRPVYSAIFLLLHSLTLAALFAVLSAALVAVGQLIIYSGAIVVLFLFVVTLLPQGGRELNPSGRRILGAALAAAGLLAAFAASFALQPLPPAATAGDLDVPAVGHAIFGPLLIPFELTAPMLLVAIIGAVVIWRRHEVNPRTAPPPATTREPRRVVLHR
jgi:NADH-quinone oxidoreductase subunit J